MSKPAPAGYISPKIIKNQRVGAHSPGLFRTFFQSLKDFVLGTTALAAWGIVEIIRAIAGLALICGLAVIAWYVCVVAWYWLRANYIG